MPVFHLEKQGETLEFLGEPDPAAPRAEVIVTIAPGALGPPRHVHTRQREIFHIESGRVILTIDGNQSVGLPGETLIVEPGQAHTFANGSPTEPLVFRAVFEPALNLYWMLSEAAKAAVRNGGSWADLPLLEFAWILFLVRREYRIARVPYFLQDLVIAPLALLARLTGAARRVAPMPLTQKAASQ
jgi:quercetin dioxygenase-like cupin family protein